MIRDLKRLSDTRYDILIVGGGIYGVLTAWDAILRGLSVAIIDKGDFGGATSANSFRIIHGGLRYLQKAKIGRICRSIYERTIFMKVAPQFVHPIPFLMPLYGHGIKGREAMFLALKMYDLIVSTSNHFKEPEKEIPGSRVLSRQECSRLMPGIDAGEIAGGAIWYDCQMSNSERLTLSFLLSAAEAGVDAANYVEATGLLMRGDSVTGIKAKDVLTGEEFDIQSRIVIDTSGPWINSFMPFRKCEVTFSRAFNIVVNKRITDRYVFGVSSRNGFRRKDSVLKGGSPLLFIAPWQGYTIIGTSHLLFKGNMAEFKITEEDLNDFVKEINSAYPYVDISLDNIIFVYKGLLPITEKRNSFDLMRRHRIYDHKEVHGIDGLISVVGVKYTEARYVSQEVVNLLFKKLEKDPPPCLTGQTPVYGGDIESFDDYLSQEIRRGFHGLSPHIIRHLVYNYGSKYSVLSKYILENHEWGRRITEDSNVIRAEVIHSIREEMAQKLSDVIIRRTGLGSACNPGDDTLKTAADIMAKELGWDEDRLNTEIRETRSVYL